MVGECGFRVGEVEECVDKGFFGEDLVDDLRQGGLVELQGQSDPHSTNGSSEAPTSDTRCALSSPFFSFRIVESVALSPTTALDFCNADVLGIIDPAAVAKANNHKHLYPGKPDGTNHPQASLGSPVLLAFRVPIKFINMSFISF